MSIAIDIPPQGIFLKFNRSDVPFSGTSRADEEGRPYRPQSNPTSENINGPDSQLWKGAMDSDIDQFEETNTWDLVELPEGRKALGNLWVLRIKRKADGSIAKRKARLVAQGFSQVPGLDSSQTLLASTRFGSFSPSLPNTTMTLYISMSRALSFRVS